MLDVLLVLSALLRSSGSATKQEKYLMCGIAGVVYFDRERTPKSSTLSAMANALRFRGPDAEGFYSGKGVGFAHRRLGVIDIDGGKQPMTDPSGRYTLCYNGEIYNFRELRQSLISAGVTFITRSDTEVLLLGYLNWGESLFTKLAGMFAFAIWDSKEETLLLCRDRLGVKPLYWTWTTEKNLFFGSELNSILATGQIEPILNPAQVARYVSLSYIPGEESILKGINRLLPGCILFWKRTGEPQVRRWWDLSQVWNGTEPKPRSLEEATEEFRERLRSAVRSRLVSDVPLGAFLSGGLDSSTVVSLMRQESEKVETFSIGFDEDSYDESKYAARVAKQLDCPHFSTKIRGDEKETLLEISSKQDEPFGDTSIIPTFCLAKMTRERVTVALSGDGGDELLAGYVTQLATSLHQKAQFLPPSLIRLAQGAANALPDSRRKVNWIFKTKRFLNGIDLPAQDAHASWRMLGNRETLAPLINFDPAHLAFDPFREAYDEVPEVKGLNRFLHVDYKTWLVDDILFKVDRASMAHGLEVRSPFLDHQLIEFCASLPSSLKLRRTSGKFLLKEVAKNLVPSFVIKRKKSGFNAPVSHWLCDSWSELVSDALLKNDSGLFNRSAIEKLWTEHRTQRRDHGYLLFALLMLGLWMKRVRPTYQGRID